LTTYLGGFEAVECFSCTPGVARAMLDSSTLLKQRLKYALQSLECKDLSHQSTANAQLLIQELGYKVGLAEVLSRLGISNKHGCRHCLQLALWALHRCNDGQVEILLPLIVKQVSVAQCNVSTWLLLLLTSCKVVA